MTDLEYQTGQANNVPSTIDVRSSAFDSDGNYLFDKNGYLVPKGSGNGRLLSFLIMLTHFSNCYGIQK